MTHSFKKLFAIISFGEKDSLKRPLVYKFLIVGLLPMLLISFVALILFNNMAKQMVGQNLDALKANKVVAIEAYGQTIVNQVVTASDDPNLIANLNTLKLEYDAIAQKGVLDTYMEKSIEEMRQLLREYYLQQFLPTYQDSNDGVAIDIDALLMQLKDEAVVLQYAYIQENHHPLGNKHLMFSSNFNLPYDMIHDQVHRTFKGYLEKFSYYDIFLVDNRGNIVYSVYKELDYGTNLISGAYATSGLGQAFQKSLELSSTQEYALIDYAQYAPSYEAPASFISSPIFDGDTRIGALIFQMPLDTISSVMSERRGLGETGESYLVGPDKLMRSDSFKMPEEYSVDASFRNNRTVDSVTVDEGFKGNSGATHIHNYLGQEVYSGYIPVKFGSLNWVLIAEIETSEAYAGIEKLSWIIFVICLITLIGIVFVAIRVSDSIVNPIETMRDAMRNISQNLCFSERVNIDRKDEIGQSAKSLNMLLANVEESVNETNEVVTAMAEGDFSQRVRSDFKGDLLLLKEGVNTSATSMGSAINEVNSAVDSLAQGDFTQSIDIDLKGELAVLKQGVNTSTLAVASAMHSISLLMQAMSRGDFTYRVQTKLVGDYKKIAGEADSAMSAISSALTEIDEVMANVANGELDARVNVLLPGQLNTIKQNVNTSLDAISSVFNEADTVLEALSKGQLYNIIEAEFPGRFNQLKVNINTTVETLTKVVLEIQHAAQIVSTGTKNIAKSNTNLSTRTEQQSSNLLQTAESMDEITVTVQHTATNAGHAIEITNKAKNGASKGGVVVKQAVSAMSEIKQASERIVAIIDVIDALAFQTNLLALNAAVEAARAGEQGRGFAVVATEVRNLAGRSANAAKEIKTLIDDSVAKVKAGSDLVTRSGETLEEIILQVDNVSSIVSEISTAAEQQSAGVTEVHRALESLQTLTQQNVAMVEQGATASEELGGQANSLTTLIQFFSTTTEMTISQET